MQVTAGQWVISIGYKVLYVSVRGANKVFGGEMLEEKGTICSAITFIANPGDQIFLHGSGQASKPVVVASGETASVHLLGMKDVVDHAKQYKEASLLLSQDNKTLDRITIITKEGSLWVDENLPTP